MGTVRMYGPDLSDDWYMTFRDVPDNDVPAYERAGYFKVGNATDLPLQPRDLAAPGNGGLITAAVESLGDGTARRLTGGDWTAQGSFADNGFKQTGEGHFFEVSFPSAMVVRQINVVFAGDVDIDNAPVPDEDSPGIVYAPLAYRLQYLNGAGYTTIVTVTDNDKQARWHAFAPVTTTKIKFIADTVRDGALYALAVMVWGLPPIPDMIRASNRSLEVY